MTISCAPGSRSRASIKPSDEIEDHIFSEKFLLQRPLLEAIRQEKPAVLLIDEIDRADEEFEAWAQAKQQVSLNVFGFRTAPTAGWQTIAGGLHVPTVLVTADPELDAIVNAEAAALAAQDPNITVVHIPGAGHNIRREQFDAFMDAVSAFLVA